MTTVPTNHLYSPSQISAYRECNRKWGWGTLAKLRFDSNASAALGTEIHKQLENHLRGKPLDYSRPSGYIAASGLHHLPPPLYPGMNLEGKFVFQSPDTQFRYHGFRDVFLPSWVEEFPDGAPVVIDHKSTSGLKWAKTEIELLSDPQSVIYARAVDSPLVHNRWVYYQTKGAKKSVPIDQKMTRDHVQHQFRMLELTTAAMDIIVGTRDGLEPHQIEDLVLSLPFNPSACSSFGGCPYQGKCNLGPEQRLAAIWATDLKPNNPLKMLEETNMSESTTSLIARLKNTPSVSGEPVATPAGGVVIPARDGVTTFSPAFAAAGINPPPVAALPYSPDIPGFVTPVPPTNAAPKPKKLTAVEKKAAKVVEAVQQSLALADTQEAPAAQPEVQSPVVVQSGYVLYVDCIPDTQAQDVAFVYAIAKGAVNDKCKVTDYRMIEYGAGPGYLATAVQDCINHGMLQGSVFVSTQCQETLACLAVLIKNAKSVVRGMR